MEHYGISEDKLVFVHRCVDVEKFNPQAVSNERLTTMIETHSLPTDKKIILLIGRLTRWKGQELLIDALAKIKDRTDFHCILTGDDQGRTEYTEGLIRKIKDNNLNERFTFIKHTDDVPALMKACDIVVSASIEPEAFGRIAAEGEAMGKIVIASNIGGSLDNLKDKITGFHFNSGDADDLSQKISYALDLDEKETQKIATSAQNYVKENFTKQIMCDKTLRLYQDLVNQE